MSCEEIRALFSDHLDGTLTPEAEDRLGQHIEACSGCREELSRYETATRALAGLSPGPPPGFGERVARRLADQGLLRRESQWGARRLLPVAASLAVFSIGLAVGRSTGPDAEPGLRLPAIAWAKGCAAGPVALPRLDPSRLRGVTEADAPERVLTAGHHLLRLPRWLTSHGPYDADTSSSVDRDGSTCLALHDPFGARLFLSVVPVARGVGDGEAFVVELDPTRVLYARVLWSRHGLGWSLEGRAQAADLLDVAREIAARTRVERTEPGQAL